MSDGSRTRLVRRVCQFCGNEFLSSRQDAKWHAPSCRTKAYRWRQRLPELNLDVLEALAGIWQYLDYPASRDQAVSFLADISRHIDGGLVDRGIKLTRVR